MTNSSLLLELGLKKRNKEISTSWQELADQYSQGFFKTGEAFRCWIKSQIRSNKPSSQTNTEDAAQLPKYKEEIEIHKDGTQSSNKLVRMSIEQSKDVNYLLEAHGYDNSAWELVSAKNNIWNVYSKTDGISTLYSSKISVKPKKDGFSAETVKELLTSMMKNYQSPFHSPTQYSVNGKMLEISIADLHLAKLCWSGDSNDTYNHEIARKRFFYILNDVLNRTKHYTFEKILFVWGNDFFHIDNANYTTTAGTRQDVDLRYAEMFKLGTQMLVEAIDLLSQFAPVHTFYIGSNHDKLTNYCATEYLSAWYRNNQNVTVDTDPKIRKYIEFGECLIQFSHGHAEGKRIGDVMSVEERAAWGRCKYNEVHAGHFHSEKTVTKDNGVIVRYLGSPSGTDQWHYESGYVGAVKKGQSFVWDRKRGLLDAIYTTVE